MGKKTGPGDPWIAAQAKQVCFWCDEPASARRSLLNHRGAGLFHKSCAAEFDATHRGRRRAENPRPLFAGIPEDTSIIKAMKDAQVSSLRDVIKVLRGLGFGDQAIQCLAESWQNTIADMLKIDDVPTRIGRLLKAS